MGRSFLDDLDEVAEILRVDEEDHGATRARARLLRQVEALFLHGVIGLVDVLHAEGEMGEATASAGLFNLLGHGRFRAERLQELDEVGAGADLHEDFADLVLAENLFAMEFGEAERLVLFHLGVEFALFDGDTMVWVV